MLAKKMGKEDEMPEQEVQEEINEVEENFDKPVEFQLSGENL